MPHTFSSRKLILITGFPYRHDYMDFFFITGVHIYSPKSVPRFHCNTHEYASLLLYNKNLTSVNRKFSSIATSSICRLRNKKIANLYVVCCYVYLFLFLFRCYDCNRFFDALRSLPRIAEVPHLQSCANLRAYDLRRFPITCLSRPPQRRFNYLNM